MWVSYIALILAALQALFVLAKDWVAHKSTWRRRTVGALIICVMGFGIFTTHRAAKEKQDDALEIFKLRRGIEAANLAEDENIRTLAELNTRLASIEAAASSQDLRKQASQIQAELRTAQRTLVPQKAKLIFRVPGTYFDAKENVTRIQPYIAHNNIVHFEVVVGNPTDVTAEDGAITLEIDGSRSKFVHAPEGFLPYPGRLEDTFRYAPFNLWYPGIQRKLAFDIYVPTPGAELNMHYVCKNCPYEDISLMPIIVGDRKD